MEKITDILYSEVITESGYKLGRVFDMRSAGEPEHGFPNKEREITELLYGERSFWEMLGFKKLPLQSIKWSDVKRIEEGKIIVADDRKEAGEE